LKPPFEETKMQEFLNNVSRYPRYLITFSLGVLLTLISPLLPMFKRPSTAIAAVGFLVAAFVCLTFTLRAMLGLSA
jgi:heme/copper-type cytochrome/quinol oxidase subunit 4